MPMTFFGGEKVMYGLSYHMKCQYLHLNFNYIIYRCYFVIYRPDPEALASLFDSK